MRAKPNEPLESANPAPLIAPKKQPDESGAPTSSSATTAVQVSSQALIEPKATISPIPIGMNQVSDAPAPSFAGPAPRKDTPLSGIVLGGPEPFNTALSPLIRIICLHTPPDAFRGSDHRDVNVGLLPQHLESDVGGQTESQNRPQPVQNHERGFGDARQSHGQDQGRGG